MGDDQIYNYVPQCSTVLSSELDKNLEDNNIPVLTVNARSITGKFADLITSINLVRKRFNFIIITDSWLIDESNSVLVIIGYKSRTIIRVGRTGGGNKPIFCYRRLV